jgi:hypothetical protein
LKQPGKNKEQEVKVGHKKSVVIVCEKFQKATAFLEAKFKKFIYKK